MIRHNLLWNGEPQMPLVVMIPGGSGTRRALMRGYEAAAGFLWLRGYSCYLAETAGQDGAAGAFSLSASLCECRDSLAELTQQLSPRDIILCGSCSGGAVATYLAAERQDTHSLILYESPPRFPQWTRDDFVVRAKQLGMVLSRDFLNEYIDTIDKAPEVSCPVLICWGTGTRPPIFVPEDGRLLADEFSNASHIGTKEYPAADHNVFRGSNARVLHTILKDIVAFVESDALQPSMSQALPAH